MLVFKCLRIWYFTPPGEFSLSGQVWGRVWQVKVIVNVVRYFVRNVNWRIVQIELLVERVKVQLFLLIHKLLEWLTV